MTQCARAARVTRLVICSLIGYILLDANDLIAVMINMGARQGAARLSSFGPCPTSLVNGHSASILRAISVHTIAIDWLYTRTTGRYGSKYALTMVDLFTKMAIALPATDKSGRSLVRLLRMIFGLYGYPQRIVSDNESMFKSDDFQQ